MTTYLIHSCILYRIVESTARISAIMSCKHAGNPSILPTG